VKLVITGHDEIFGPWLMDRVKGHWFASVNGHTIGLWDDRQHKPVAAVYYEACNGASVLLHCAGDSKSWLNREFLWYVFHYAFEELKVNKILSPVESANTDSCKFIQHIGFSLEATLEDASPKGDLLIFSMKREDCKWLSLKEKYRGQTQSTSTS